MTAFREVHGLPKRVRGKQSDRGTAYEGFNSAGEGKSTSGGNEQQALRRQAPLMIYGSGVREIRRGGGKTIAELAPVLELNEAADDPYGMRPKTHHKNLIMQYI